MADASALILDALATPSPLEKAQKARAIFAAWQDGSLHFVTRQDVPNRPARPERPPLMAPRDVPKRRITRGVAGRVALLHAIAHIELNAIDLALDMAVRYVHHHLPADFTKDWLSVADDEARHFTLLSNRLAELDSHYGALPAHDGLWQAAEKTKDDFLGRLAIAPLVLEARGLDVTPQLLAKFKEAEDTASADILEIIMTDEVGHVGIGKRWFDYQCGMERLDPISTWQGLVKRYFHGQLKPPFNISARNAARFSAAFYKPLAEGYSA
ncbi:MAG: ferritin-like domain-containing protein [Candidatus Puniceispirillaceae bacterium]